MSTDQVPGPRRVSALLHPPMFQDEELTRQARVLHAFLLALLVLALLQTAAGIILVPQRWSWHLLTLLVLTILLAATFVTARRGALQRATIILIAGLFLIVGSVAINRGGFSQIGYLSGAALVVCAGVLVSTTAAVITSAAILSVAAFMPALLRLLALNRTPLTVTPIVLVSGAFGYGVIVLLIAITTKGLREALRRAGDELRERREVDAALRASQQHYEQVVSSTPGVVYEYITRPDGRHAFPFMSDGVLDLLGIPPGELIADSEVLFRQIPPDARATVERTIAESHAALKPWALDFPIYTRRGTPKWIRGRSVPLAREDGAVVCHGVLTDITDQKGALSLLQAALEATTDGILIVGTDGHVTGRNQRFLETWRVPPDVAASTDDERLLAHTLSQVVDPDGFRSKARDLRADPEAVSFDTLALRDGRVIERYSLPQRIGRRTVGRVWSFRDVTEARRAEAVRRQLEDRLVQSQKLEALGTMAGGIAHDFNNILTAIVGHAELAQWDAGPAGREAMQEVVRAVGRAGEMVQQMVLVGRVQLGERRPVGLRDLLADVAESLRGSLGNEIEVVTTFPDEDIVVQGSASQLQHALMSLGVNAGEAIGHRAGQVRLTLSHVPAAAETSTLGLPSGRYSRIAVEDDGSGMDSATMERIFEPFFTTRAAGRGLGLAVVHNVARGHGGAVAVESTPGVGSRFRVYLPTVAMPVPEPGSPGPGNPSAGSGAHILAVEDEPAIADLLRSLLARIGYRVSVHEDPARALEALRSNPEAIDLLFTDLSMPGMNGVDLGLAALRLRPDLPVVLATGFDQGWTTERLQAIGFRALVGKPYSLRQVAAVLAEILTARDPPGPLTP